MTLTQTYAWIFYAVGLASQKESADYAAIESLADGINHAIPTQKEMQVSLKWLESQGFIEKEGKRYRLSNIGDKLLNEASASKKTIAEIWKLIQQKFSEMGIDDVKQINPRTMRADNII